MGKVIAVCASPAKGTPKTPRPEAVLVEGHGMEGDAHAGGWHRQISILPLEHIEAFRRRGADVAFGDFGENLVVAGIDVGSMRLGERIRVGEAELELTQHGKECHARCRIYESVGDCIMPKHGVFARVVKGGAVRVGDGAEPLAAARAWGVAVVTVSDKGARGEREDKSGEVVADLARAGGYAIVSRTIVPDDFETICGELRRLCGLPDVALVLTTGGTGFSPRDVTPEATLAVAERLCPGIPEAMRHYSLAKTKRAMLSRAAAGIRGKTLIVNLPGSPKAARECLEFVLDELEHGLEILRGEAGECGNASTVSM